MHTIEPYYNWRDYYIVTDDERMPFFRKEYSEFEFSTTIYNYYIHPQWDEIGSPTLFIKILFIDYNAEFAVIELMGEWNDCINNDIMYFKRNIIEKMMRYNINKFVLIGENVLNFHASDECYYEEWFEEVNDEGGWIAGLNFRDHVLAEMNSVHINYYILTGDRYKNLNWRNFEPTNLFSLIDNMILKAIH